MNFQNTYFAYIYAKSLSMDFHVGEKNVYHVPPSHERTYHVFGGHSHWNGSDNRVVSGEGGID